MCLVMALVCCGVAYGIRFPIVGRDNYFDTIYLGQITKIPNMFSSAYEQSGPRIEFY